MQNVNSKRLQTKKSLAETMRRDEVTNRLKFAAAAEREALLNKLNTTPEGMSETLVDASREQYGDNKVTHGKKTPLIKRIAIAFINPFTAILFGLATVSAI
ncbi:MAG: cation-transporting P-type ATPase, partial [Sporomusa sp.]